MPKRRREPIRTCVACRQEAEKETLVRIVRDPGGRAAVDLGGHAPGRGAYLHRNLSCVEVARKKKVLERALGTAVGPEVWMELGV